MDMNKLFEELYVKNAPSWSIERDPDGSYKYHATQSAFLLFEQQQVEIESLKMDLAKASAMSEDLDYKQLYKYAIINSKKDKYKLNWAHVAGLGVGSGKAKEILRSFNIDPEATEMHKTIEAQEPSHD